MHATFGETTAVKADEELERRFAEFVAQHRDRAIGMAWRLVGGEGAAAEDVAQEAFARAYRALPRFRDESQLSTWFYRILVNESRRALRWRGVRRRFGVEPALDAAPPQAPKVGDPALRRRIRDAVAALPRGQREIFVLVHLEGLSVREAADATGRAVGTAKSHLHRALRALREALSDLRDPQESARETS